MLRVTRHSVMKSPATKHSRSRIAVLDSEPLRFVGFCTLFDTESDLEFLASGIPELPALGVDLVMLDNCKGQKLFESIASLKAALPGLKIIVTGSDSDDETILKALTGGANGYVNEAAAPSDLVQAIRTVYQGTVWAPRRVLSIFIERVASSGWQIFPSGRISFTCREKEVLALLVAARGNKDIGSALGITERTVKAHVGTLMRKVGVQNRIELTVHAITHGLVSK